MTSQAVKDHGRTDVGPLTLAALTEHHQKRAAAKLKVNATDSKTPILQFANKYKYSKLSFVDYVDAYA